MKQNKFFTCLLILCAITSLFIACKPKDVVLTDIKVTTLPTATEWTVGSSSFSTAGMVVTATYSNDETKAFTEFPEPAWQITGFNSSAVTDALPITVSYTEGEVTKSDTFNIQIVAAPFVIDHIEIFSPPSQTEYAVGESLNIVGLSIKMITNEGNEVFVSTFPESEWTFTGFTSEAQNDNIEVTVTFKNNWSECSTSFFVSVTAEVDGITLSNAPTKDEYFIGEDLDLTGLEIELSLTDGNTRTVSDFPATAWKISGFDKQNESKACDLFITLLLNGAESEFSTKIATVRVVDIKSLIISNYEDTYFPGEAMRPMTITLTVVAEDWEEERTIAMDDPNLAFAGFDSSAPSAASSIHATYAKGSTFDTFSFGYKVVETYKFCKEPKKLINHNGTAGLSDSEIEGITDDTEGVVKYATYVEFGDYPQTIVKEDQTEVKFYWGDAERTLNRGGVPFTLGSDGNYYVKIKENAKNTNVDNSRTYSDGSLMKLSSANSERIFKVEPIKWRVMDTHYNESNYTMLMAEAAIDGIKFAKNASDRTIDEKKVYPNNYKFSNIRAFLNGKHEANDSNDDHSNNNFINIAFTPEAAALLRETLVKNDYASAKIDYYENNFICTDDSHTSSWFGDSSINSIIYRDSENNILGIKNNALGVNSNKEYSTYKQMVSEMFVCDDTNDSIFLLSVADLKNTARYGFKDETLAVDHGDGDSDAIQYSADQKRVRPGTDYTYANNAIMFNGGCIWAARSPQWASSMKRTPIVRISGSGTLFDIIHSQNYKDWISRNDAQIVNGLVPAICIEFDIQ